MMLTLIYAAFNIMLNRKVTADIIIHTLTWGKTIIANGWYLQTILIFYALYYFVYGLSDKKSIVCNRFLIIKIFALTVLYIVTNLLMDWESVRYNSIFAFSLGILWCEYRNKIDIVIEKCWFVSVIVSFISFAVTFVTGVKFSQVTLLSSVAFVIFALIVLMKIPVNCAVTRWLGQYYFEIYVMQGIALLFFHSDIAYIENGWLYSIICTVGTLVLAVVIHPLFAWIGRSVKGKGLKTIPENGIK